VLPEGGSERSSSISHLIGGGFYLLTRRERSSWHRGKARSCAPFWAHYPIPPGRQVADYVPARWSRMPRSWASRWKLGPVMQVINMKDFAIRCRVFPR
jgi:hypothetical protein